MKMLGENMDSLSRQQPQASQDCQPASTSSSGESAGRMTSLLLALKLVNTMLQLAEILDTPDLWRGLEQLLMDGRPECPPMPMAGTAAYSFSSTSLLHALICCYKSYLMARIWTSEEQKKKKEGLQHLRRIGRPDGAPTKSFQAHVQIHEQATKQAKIRSSSDMIALLLARILARILQPDSLRRAAWVVMLDYSLPIAILDSIAEVRCFDHCEVRLLVSWMMLMLTWKSSGVYCGLFSAKVRHAPLRVSAACSIDVAQQGPCVSFCHRKPAFAG